MKRILLVFGTRPEAIKMCVLAKAIKKDPNIDLRVCVTAQHREMLDQVLSFFDVRPEYDLNLMRPNQNLYQLTSDVISGLKPVLEDYNPDYVLVHGDTTTSTAAALAAFYYGAKVGHVEAGLRTYNKKEPFPEETNRQITSRIADFHFSPTKQAEQNLLKEAIDPKSIFITGNTVIDALFWTEAKLKNGYSDTEIEYLNKTVDLSKKTILVTGHRRENFGKGFLNICEALREIANRYPESNIIYPVHLNPNVQQPVYKLLDGISNIQLIKPLAYPAFVWLMMHSHIILTDSGGVQEEAPSLGKPVLVMRDVTERPEAVAAGTVKMVGTNVNLIINAVTELLEHESVYTAMSKAGNPYGDGSACERIVKVLI